MERDKSWKLLIVCPPTWYLVSMKLVLSVHNLSSALVLYINPYGKVHKLEISMPIYLVFRSNESLPFTA